jgi:hypothetical protein
MEGSTSEAVHKHSSLLERLGMFKLLLISFLLPVLVIPMQVIPFTLTKTVLVTFGALLLFVLFIVSRILAKEIHFPKSAVVPALLLLPIAAFVSALFSGVPMLGIFGQMVEGDPAAVRWGGVSHPWSGWSKDDPFNNYYYSFLEATMFTGLATYGENAQAQQWINKFYDDKITAQLIPAMNTIPGGGSLEGTGYGTALKRLFKLYFWWEKSTGVNIANQTPHTLGTMFWFAHSVVPSLDKLVPTGDHSRDATAELYDYHRDLLQNLISLYPNEQASGAIKTLLAQSNVPRMQFSASYWSDFINEWPSIASQPLSVLNTTYFGNGTGNFYTRSAWNTNAIMVHTIAGPYDQSHAHKDQGSFMLNVAGAWLFDDANRRSNSGIDQEEEFHNLVRFRSGGATVRQVEGASPSQVVAVSDGTLFSYELMNTKPIYNNKAEVVKSEREMLFIKSGAVVLFDRAVSNASAVARIFQLQMSAAPFISGNQLTFTSGAHRADVWRVSPAAIPWTTVQAKMAFWGYGSF